MAGRLRVLARLATNVLAGTVLVAVAVLIVGTRGSFAAAELAALDPADVPPLAAAAIERATQTDGGAGIEFTIVQRLTLTAHEGEPLDDGSTSHDLGTYIERGIVVPDGFWSEIRVPDDPEAVDPAAGSLAYAALVRDGVTWRTDGAGWYRTERPPGIGLDPASAALLPTLLREATEVREAELATVDPRITDATDPVRVLTASVDPADIPGLIAVDLSAVTAIEGPATLAFDADGRLVGLSILARKTDLARADFTIATTFTFAYPLLAPGLPEPEPAYVEPKPDPDASEEDPS
jgi:hypothetical protein